MAIDLSKINKENAGKLFDLAILAKTTTDKEIIDACNEAKKWNCMAVCTSSSYFIPLVKEQLKKTDIHIGAGVGFPFGQQTSKVKAYETQEARELGATVFDNCMNVGAFKEKKYNEVLKEFKEYVSAASGAITKMIIEVGFLTDEEVKIAAELVCEAGIDYCKTSTGQFGYTGPNMTHCKIIANTLKGTNTKVKISGINYPWPQNAYSFFLAGADLIGTSRPGHIIENLDLMREIGLVPKYKK